MLASSASFVARLGSLNTAQAWSARRAALETARAPGRMLRILTSVRSDRVPGPPAEGRIGRGVVGGLGARPAGRSGTERGPEAPTARGVGVDVAVVARPSHGGGRP